MKTTAALALALGLAGAATAQAQPANLQNARLTTKEIAPGSLASQLDAQRAVGAHWVAWSVPGGDKGHVCCFESADRAARGAYCCGGCRLESGGAFFDSRKEREPIPLDRVSRLLVFARYEKSTLSDVRVFSSDCALDAAGRAVAFWKGVPPEESVAWLAGLVDAGVRSRDPKRRVRHDDDDFNDDLADRAITAIALHETAAADRALDGFVARGQPLGLRKKAAFWLGNSRGAAGFAALKKAIEGDPSAAFREHATFAVSQSPVPEAVPYLLSMAKRDLDAEVRGQALFWLAQKAGEKAAADIEGAIRDDPDADVKVKAVFALTQIPGTRGVPELIRVARTSKTPEVREQAVFWLGQSKDRRALDFIEEVLTR